MFCPNWTNSFTILSGNLLHRIGKKKEKQNDFKHVVLAVLVLSSHTFYKVTTGSTEYLCDILVNSSRSCAFGPNWSNSLMIISGNLLHRIDQNKEKQSDFNHVVAATLVLS